MDRAASHSSRRAISVLFKPDRPCNVFSQSGLEVRAHKNRTVAGTGCSLAKPPKAVSNALGLFRRASQKAVIHVAMRIAKGAVIRCKARLVGWPSPYFPHGPLAANRFLACRVPQHTLVGVPDSRTIRTGVR